MKMNLHADSMVVKILGVVAAGILCVVLAISTIIINISENVFIDTYGKSQEQVFYRIEEELNEFHESLSKILDSVNASMYLKMYLQSDKLSSRLAFQTAYKTKVDMERAIPSSIVDNVNIMIIGTEGTSYLNKAETIIVPVNEILEAPSSVYAMENPTSLHYTYARTGYTATTRNTPVVMAVKALMSPGASKPYAVAYITIKEKELMDFYSYFISDNTDFYLLDEDNMVVSSSDKTCLGEQMDIEEMDHKGKTIFQKELPYYHFTAYGMIDNYKALGNLYDVPFLWMICIGIMTVSGIIICLIVGQTTKPLSELVKKMSNARTTKFDEHINLKGSREVVELSGTYNAMLDDLNRYIDELMNIQKQKRKAEISALQMQINPHYIYNTLASIKWLIFQKDIEKSTTTIDAFISLLRNTISNMDEYITVEQDLENLKNYVLINNTRYGDRIQVEYFVTYGCEHYKIPKMILQPFVENSFFHGFPYNERGSIKILIRTAGGKLQIQITDNGVGMTQEQIQKLADKGIKTEHFSGIGINNIHDRLKLIYGEEYQITIESKENEGTEVTILIPALLEE